MMPRKTSKALVTTAGITSGRVTLQTTYKGERPRLAAASSIVVLTRLSAPRTTRKTSG